MNAAAKHQPDLLERPASLLVPTWTKTGLALLYDKHTSNTYDVRLKLTKELLIVQKQDVVCVNGGDSHLNNCCTSKTDDWRSRSEYQRGSRT